MSGLHLGLDTATPFLCIAIWSTELGTLAAMSERVDRAHAGRLIPALERLLRQAGAERQDISAVAAGTGPGSYTGLRVGAAAALGLARSLQVPLVGVDTLSAIAKAGLEDGEEGLAALDARRGNIYVGRYRRLGDGVATVAAPAKLALEEALKLNPGVRLIEGLAPDPVYLARQASGTEPFVPRYL